MNALQTLPGAPVDHPLPAPGCIHANFEAQARRTPNAIALTWNGRGLAYRELNAAANRWAVELTKAGVGPERPVAIFLERSFDLVVAILSVLKAGGPYVPIDLAYPRERIAFMLEDTAAPVILTQTPLAARLPDTGARVICVDNLPADAVEAAGEGPEGGAEPDNTAYIIYTSGSTGQPKGVMVSHRNVVRLLRQTEPWFAFNERDVMPMFHSCAFDMSVWELWAALFYGGRLVIVPQQVTRSPHDFYELLARERVTLLNQTPSAFRQLIWAEQTAATRHPLALRFVTCGGEALELQALKPWFELHGDTKPVVVNMYGITETTVHTTYRPIRVADLDKEGGSPIGVPIPDLQVHLLDDRLQPVSRGEPGEICVGGAGVARGYLNRPELTAQRFVPDPYSASPDATLYRSGDLARVNEEGEMEYLGRMDHQVKIRGYRVELGEIESVLNSHPAVRESVVLAREDAHGDKHLAAYVVFKETGLALPELRAHVGRLLPDYMVPSTFTFLPALPLTNNGKVDRRALPEPSASRPRLESGYAAPQTDAECVLAAVWTDVLGIEEIGIDDNFFQLGGDSIRSLRVISKARERGTVLSLPDLFAHPTVRELAERSMAARPSEPAVPTSAAQPFALVSAADRSLLPGDVEDAYPVATLQLGMFFHNELDPASAIYHDVFSFRVQARFEEARFVAALDRLVNRHPILRTSFHLAGYSEPLQLVHRNVRTPFSTENLAGLAESEMDARLVQWIEAEKRRPFDRMVPPLARFHVQVRSAGCFQFIFSFHHACVDGWSLAAAVTEVLRDYLGAGRPERPPAANYREFVALERSTLASESARQFWKDYLEGVVPQQLPRWPRSMCVGGHEQVRSPEFDVPAEVLAGLRSLARKAGVPLKSVLFAAHLRVVAWLHGADHVLTGLVSNGRPETPEADETIGLFLNTVPVRQALAGGNWLDLVRDAFASEQRVMPHRRFPMAEIQKLAGSLALLETAFDFVHFHVYNDLPGGRLDFAEGHYFEANNLATYTTFMLDASSERLELHLDYDPNVVCFPHIQEICSCYLATLRAMARNPEESYLDFCPLAESERRRILEDFNHTEAPYPRDVCVHELFEARARENPDAVAVAGAAGTLTYRELNDRAANLAGELQSFGVGPEVRVGICLDRSPDMVVALLAILKAGGAYVPLDPAYPRERNGFMLEDSAAAVLITQTELPVPAVPQGCRTLFIDPGPRHTAAQFRNASSGRPGAENLAYLIYTSGSTGRPKGVQVTHRSVVNLLLAAARRVGFQRGDTLLAVTTLCFDIAALEIFMPLVAGGTVWIAPRETAVNGLELARLVEHSNAGFLQATPATWRLLIDTGWTGNSRLRGICGGEALKDELADSILARVSGLWNFYGPTETTIWSTAAELAPGQTITIGRPLANTRVYILNGRMQPVPVGAPGELYIGGDGVARGYWNRPDLDAERFLTDPFVSTAQRDLPAPQARLYRTGDLARWLPDGRIECLGRLDAQVKIRGFRIEPGEVEAALRQHHGIKDALVTAREDAHGNSRLIGYLVSRNGPPSVPELREFLKSRLPAHMVPAQFVLLTEIPLTPNGKVNARLLPPPETDAQPPTAFVAPRNPREQALADIWADVLSLKRVGIEDDFFELGADSLSATRAYARISQSVDAEISLKDLFEHRSVRALAAVLESRKPGDRRTRPIIRQARLGAS